MGKINSNKKGKRGELEFVHFLKDRGIDARRGQQFKGTKDSPDVLSSMEHIAIEVKRKETLSLYPALEKAIEDASDEDYAVVFHRRSNKPWVAILLAKDFLDLIGEGE